MSSVSPDIHPLVHRLREVLGSHDTLTQEQAASEIGVSLRTIVYWMTEDVTPQKRYRPQLADWLERQGA